MPRSPGLASPPHQPVRVMHLVLSLEPGGMENGVVNLANLLDPRLVETTICCINTPGAFVDRLQSPSIVHCLNKKPGFSLPTVLRLLHLIRQLRPDVVHTHNLGPLLYAVGARIGDARWKLIHGEHSQPAPGELSLRRRVQRRVCYSFCDRIVPVSASLGKLLTTELDCPASLIQPILNGVDTARFRSDPERRFRSWLKLPPNAFVIGQVARFGQFKRHRLLIQAFEHLADDHGDAYLLLVGGGGSEEAPVRQAVESSRHARRIVQAGFHQDTSAFYQTMDLLVIPSLKEGLANAALEAMSTEVAVLTHDACGHADIIEDGVNGFVRHLAGLPETITALREMIADRSRLATAGRAARKTVVERFSLQRMINEYSDLYAKVSES